MQDERGSPPDWVNNNWFRNHLAIAPAGTMIVTWILLATTGDAWQWWSDNVHLKTAGQVAPFGAALYGTVMFSVERIARVLVKAFRYDKDTERARKEGIRIGQGL